MQVAENWLSVASAHGQISVYGPVKESSVQFDKIGLRMHVSVKGVIEASTYQYEKNFRSLEVLGQLAIGRWMEVTPEMMPCIDWIERELRRINRREKTKFLVRTHRLSVHLCRFGLVGG